MSAPDPQRDAFQQLLVECRDGGREALDRLVPPLYSELRRLAHHYMKGERSGHTLQTTALVHEAYARLVGRDIAWEDRARFFRTAGLVMRRVLVDHARARGSAKRGAGRARVTFEEAKLGQPGPAPDVVELDDALQVLAKDHERKAQVVELHFFVGLSHKEIARVLEISPATVDRDMSFARAWLRSALAKDSVARRSADDL